HWLAGGKQGQEVSWRGGGRASHRRKVSLRLGNDISPWRLRRSMACTGIREEPILFLYDFIQGNGGRLRPISESPSTPRLPPPAPPVGHRDAPGAGQPLRQDRGGYLRRRAAWNPFAERPLETKEFIRILARRSAPAEDLKGCLDCDCAAAPSALI